MAIWDKFFGEKGAEPAPAQQPKPQPEPAAGLAPVLGAFALGVNVEEIYIIFGEQVQTQLGGLPLEIYAVAQRKLALIGGALSSLGLPEAFSAALKPIKARIERGTRGQSRTEAEIQEALQDSLNTANEIGALMGQIRKQLDDVRGLQYDPRDLHRPPEPVLPDDPKLGIPARRPGPPAPAALRRGDAPRRPDVHPASGPRRGKRRFREGVRRRAGFRARGRGQGPAARGVLRARRGGRGREAHRGDPRESRILRRLGLFAHIPILACAGARAHSPKSSVEACWSSSGEAGSDPSCRSTLASACES